jgi:hypothetical protein
MLLDVINKEEIDSEVNSCLDRCVEDRHGLFSYSGRFIMFSVNTNIYSKKTKGPALVELFTATGKVKTFFLTARDVRCLQHG